MTAAALAFLLGAGFLAGIVGTAGGITSLIAYPALLAVGVPPLAANVTCSIALVGSGLGATFAHRHELLEHRVTVRRWAPTAVLGAVAGAVLLLVTPESAFERIVPWLIVAASALLLFQPRIATWQQARGGAPKPWLTASGVAFIAVYDGYFGAGAGIMMIALVLVLIEHDLVKANAIKNVLLVIADLLPAVVFAVFGPTDWWGVLGVGVGATLGGLVGPVVARRIPRTPLRLAIAFCGLGLAVYLLLT